MHIEFLVEEPSIEIVLEKIVRKILTEDISFKIHPHQGKFDLLAKLENKLRAYKKWLSTDDRIVVLIDLDNQDRRTLKEDLEITALRSGFKTKSTSKPGESFQVLNRLAIEELEAWYFGDIQALTRAFPKISTNIDNKSAYRNPDAIKGGTWEALGRILKKNGYLRKSFLKMATARQIAPHLDPSVNRSKSFQVFRDGLLAMIG